MFISIHVGMPKVYCTYQSCTSWMIRSKARLRLLKDYLLEILQWLSVHDPFYIFDMAGRIEISLQLLGIFLSSGVKIACTFPFFQSSGNIPVSTTWFIISHIEFEMYGLQSCRVDEKCLGRGRGVLPIVAYISRAPAHARRAWDRAPYSWNMVNLFSFGCHVIDRAYVRTRLQIVWVG